MSCSSSSTVRHTRCQRTARSLTIGALEAIARVIVNSQPNVPTLVFNLPESTYERSDFTTASKGKWSDPEFRSEVGYELRYGSGAGVTLMLD